VRDRCLILLALLVGALSPVAAALPAKPADYVLDEAGVLSAPQRRELSRRLAQYERETSNQILVATFPDVPSDYVLEDFTQRTAEAWGAGQRGNDNGIVLFVFPQARQLRIEVGYGLEGAVPDALAAGIINAEIVPLFRAGRMGDGIERGATALMEAARGEYTGSGRTWAERQQAGQEDSPWLLLFLIIFILLLVIAARRSGGSGGTIYTPGGRRDVWIPSHPGGFGGKSFGGGGFGGGFMGGGGGFGGGGASGRW
jgi:uncharacterized protein